MPARLQVTGVHDWSATEDIKKQWHKILKPLLQISYQLRTGEAAFLLVAVKKQPILR